MRIKALVAAVLVAFLLAPAVSSTEDRDPETIVRDTTETVLQELRDYDGDIAEDPDFVHDLVRREVRHASTCSW